MADSKAVPDCDNCGCLVKIQHLEGKMETLCKKWDRLTLLLVGNMGGLVVVLISIWWDKLAS